MEFEKAIIIRDKTRLEQLIERFNSKAQARFYIERSGGDFDYYEAEHERFYSALGQVREQLSAWLKVKVIERNYLPTYLFTDTDLIVVVGQDGLVANTAKYVKEQPLMAVNPDPDQYDGVLLPFTAENVHKGLSRIRSGKFDVRKITMAEARMSDGQTLLAFNDFYIGASSHVSSRYALSFKGKSENQSSSGIIVSTGAGSTGWLSSIFNMANNVFAFSHANKNIERKQLSWESDQLIFVVREPFQSHVTQTEIGCGLIDNRHKLTLESRMPTNGVIFSDGIESDYLPFNTGSKVEIGLARQKAILITL